MKSTFTFYSLSVLLCFSFFGYSQKTKTITLADPTIFLNDGTYYLYGTGAPNGFRAYTSQDLEHWQKLENASGLALQKGDAYGDKGFWAPQIFEYNGKFYMAYTANEQIAIASSDSPAGPFTQKNKIAIPSEERMIDPFVYFAEDGKIYLYHVRVANGGNRIFVAELNDDLSEIKDETLTQCIEATDKWENTENSGWTVTEGPTIVKRNGLYYMLYSANDFRNKDYAVGYATSKSLTGPWEKVAFNPVLVRDMLGEDGTGHGDLFTGEDGQLYYVLHTHNSSEKVSPRKTALIKVHFETQKNNSPDKLVFEMDSFRFLTVEE